MNAAHFQRSLALLAGLGLAGCAAVGPDYAPPATEVPAGWNRLDAVTGTVARDQAPGDLSQWWQGLNDPLLSELVDEALRSSPDLRSAQARLREARARRTVAASARFPGVTASAGASRSESSEQVGNGDTRNYFSAGFDASWEADVFGGVRRSIEAAEADLESSRANLQASRVSLAAEVASS